MQDICNRCTVNSAILIVNDTQGLFAGWVACRVLWRPRNHLKGMVAVNFKNANNQQNHQSDCSSLPSLHLYYVCNLQWNFNIECICNKKKTKNWRYSQWAVKCCLLCETLRAHQTVSLGISEFSLPVITLQEMAQREVLWQAFYCQQWNIWQCQGVNYNTSKSKWRWSFISYASLL